MESDNVSTPMGSSAPSTSSTSALGGGIASMSSLATSMGRHFGQTLTAAALSATSALTTVANTASNVIPSALPRQDRDTRERELREFFFYSF